MFHFICIFIIYTYIVDFYYTHTCFVFHLAFYFLRVHGSLFCITILFNGFSSVFVCVCCSVTVLTKWVTPPKMVYNWFRVWWSRSQLYNCTHFRYPTDDQLLISFHFYFNIIQVCLCSLNSHLSPLWTRRNTFCLRSEQRRTKACVWNRLNPAVLHGYIKIVWLDSYDRS